VRRTRGQNLDTVNTTEPPAYRLGVDIGGTFTDVVLVLPDGSIKTRKVASTPSDYSEGILQCITPLLDEQGCAGEVIDEIVHGTTVATNAILEYTGARTALLTTAGFRDVLELRRVRAPELYNPFYSPPAPLVERDLRLEINERTAASGEEIEAVDVASVERAITRLRERDVEAVAVCLLHSYANADHERRVGDLVCRGLPGVFVSLSVDILPEIREYERTSTTVINAYVGPGVSRYLTSLRRRLETAGIKADLLVMQSNGGVMAAREAGQRAAQIVESGPAAGVIAAHRLGERTQTTNLITFDMGGTTAKAALIEDGQLSQTTEYEVGAGISLSSRLVKGGGHAIKLPVLDIAEVGAGGGSIVWIDRGGALKVGPRSAGAVPGPACYDAGGSAPTVTDANLILGYLNPSQLAGGAIKLRLECAERALREQIAEPLGLDLLEAAYGVFRVATANMMRAVKAVSTYRGRDPRDFTVLAFGGNGPVFAVELARALEIRRVIVPPAAGLFSAFGLLEAAVEHHYVRTVMLSSTEPDPAALGRALAELEARAHAERPRERVWPRELLRFADLRYRGQAFELTIPLPSHDLDRRDLMNLVEDFGCEHERTYGHRADDEPVEIVNVRLVARAPRPRLARAGGNAHGYCLELGGTRNAYFGRQLGVQASAVIARAELSTVRPGPLIVEEYDATTVVPPGSVAHVDNSGNIVIDVD
jgi:N-methylhydantoinase A